MKNRVIRTLLAAMMVAIFSLPTAAHGATVVNGQTHRWGPSSSHHCVRSNGVKFCGIHKSLGRPFHVCKVPYPYTNAARLTSCCKLDDFGAAPKACVYPEP